MSKPVLSELEYNADDVASAILQKADLSVTNEDLGVTDQSSNFAAESGWSITNKQIYSFNGFMFISFTAQYGSTPSNGDALVEITDEDIRPTTNTIFPSISYEVDTVNCIVVQTNGEIIVSHPSNPGSEFHVAINGFYRY